MTRRSLQSDCQPARGIAPKKQPSLGSCVRCHLAVPSTDCFMLDDFLWEAVHPKGPAGMMHLSCVEKALGRRLKRSDFSRAPTNRMMSLLNPALRARRRPSAAELRKGAADLVRLLVEQTDISAVLLQRAGAAQLLSKNPDLLLRLQKRELREFRQAHPQVSGASWTEPLLNIGTHEGTPPPHENAE